MFRRVLLWLLLFADACTAAPAFAQLPLEGTWSTHAPVRDRARDQVVPGLAVIAFAPDHTFTSQLAAADSIDASQPSRTGGAWDLRGAWLCVQRYSDDRPTCLPVRLAGDTLLWSDPAGRTVPFLREVP